MIFGVGYAVSEAVGEYGISEFFLLLAAVGAISSLIHRTSSWFWRIPLSALIVLACGIFGYAAFVEKDSKPWSHLQPLFERYELARYETSEAMFSPPPSANRLPVPPSFAYEKTEGAHRSTEPAKSAVVVDPPIKGFPSGGFSEEIQNITIQVGTNIVQVGVSDLEKSPMVLSDIGLVVSWKDNALHYSIALENGIKISDNQFIASPNMRWDSNSNANAFEVVNRNNVPVFQLVRKGEAHLAIYGSFPTADNRIWTITDKEHSYHPKFDLGEATESELKPIFKYPSWKYPGQYAN